MPGRGPVGEERMGDEAVATKPPIPPFFKWMLSLLIAAFVGKNLENVFSFLRIDHLFIQWGQACHQCLTWVVSQPFFGLFVASLFGAFLGAALVLGTSIWLVIWLLRR